MPELISKRVNDHNGVNMFPLYEEWLDIGRMTDFNKANNSKKNV